MARQSHPDPQWRSPRYPSLDMVRGFAIVLMVAYHFSFDLNYFGIIRQNMNYQPFWLWSRSLIVTLFLLTMGASLYLATAPGVNWRRYLRRLGMIAGAAVLVSIASKVMFPSSWIFFGVLHFIALASAVGLLFVRIKWINLVLGAGLLALGKFYAHPFFDQPAWQWFGLMTHKPITEDYVPVLPWFGVVLMGIFLGRVVYGSRQGPAPEHGFASRPLALGLAWGGRHALAIYLLHQPLLLGVTWLGVTAAGFGTG